MQASLSNGRRVRCIRTAGAGEEEMTGATLKEILRDMQLPSDRSYLKLLLSPALVPITRFLI